MATRDVLTNSVHGRNRPPLFTRAFGLLLLVQFSYGLAFSTFFALPKYLLQELGASAALVGNAHGAFAIAGAVAVPFVGALTDRWGRKRVLRMGVLLGAISFAPLGFVTALPAVLVLRAIHGISWSMMFAAGGTLAIDLAPASRRAEAVGYFGTAMLVTNAIGPFLGEKLADRAGWPAVFVACSSCAALAWLIAGALRAPTPLPSTGGLFAFPCSRALAGTYLATLAIGVGVGASKTYLPAAMVEEGARNVGPYFVGFALGALFQRTAMGWLPDRIGRGRATVAAIAAYGSVLAVVFPIPRDGLAWLSPLIGLAHGTAYPASAALAADASDPGERGRVTAWGAGFFNLGFALGSSGLAPLEPLLGYRGLVTLAGVALVTAAVLLPFLLGRGTEPPGRDPLRETPSRP